MPVQVLPYVQSPLEQLMPYISQAVGQVGEGIQKGSALKQLMSLENKSNQNISDKNKPNKEPLTDLEIAQAANAAKVAGLDPNIYAKALIDRQKTQQKIAAQQRQFEQQNITKAEPELIAREEKLEHYEQEASRFARLQELFSPELENKFPSSFSVGLLTKDGELRPQAAALLSPEAQESVKLIADNLSGAKDTFGARVTNFDLQAYMKRLPTLLNSAEGRRRVLRDLRLMNQLNLDHQQGVLDIIEREGGPGKISISQAERRYKKEHAKEISETRKEFVNPEKHVFSDKPNPSVYSGRIIVDEETGEKFRSNGKEWVPE